MTQASGTDKSGIRAEEKVFHLRLDQRTLQLWGGFGAHVCQLGCVCLPAESHGLAVAVGDEGALCFMQLSF